MKYPVKTFKSMKICLKELETFIRDGRHLQTGRPLAKFGGLLSREILGNWLICAVLNFEQQSESLKIYTDPTGGDGIIYDVKKKLAEHMEHVSVSQNNRKLDNTEALILEQINKKQNKGGEAYASGKTLVVFLDKKGENWIPNKIAKKLPENLHFNGVWVVGLQIVTNDKYIYNVTKLDVNGCAVWQVYIDNNFNDWRIEQIQ